MTTTSTSPTKPSIAAKSPPTFHPTHMVQVIIGGLLTSTALEFLVRPALFWRFGTTAAQQVTEEEEQQINLVEEARGSGVEQPGTHQVPA